MKRVDTEHGKGDVPRHAHRSGTVDQRAVAELPVRVLPPAIDGPRGGEPAGVVVAGAETDESQRACYGDGTGPGYSRAVTELAGAVAAPAVSRAVRGKAARVPVARVDGREADDCRDGGGCGTARDRSARRRARIRSTDAAGPELGVSV